jgi:hypothetical protein
MLYILPDYAKIHNRRLCKMLTKRTFEKGTVKYNTETDMGLNGSYNFLFWDDPSRPVVMTLVDTISMNEERLNKMSVEEKEKADADFWKAVSQVMIDCEIEGLDFSTPEKAKTSFDSEIVPWGWLWDVLVFFIGRLLAENKRLGELLARLKKA